MPASPLTKICITNPVLRFVRVESAAAILRLAHVSQTFREALEDYGGGCRPLWRYFSDVILRRCSDNGDDGEDGDTPQRQWLQNVPGKCSGADGDNNSKNDSTTINIFRDDALAWIVQNSIVFGGFDPLSGLQFAPVVVASAAGAADVVHVLLLETSASVPASSNDSSNRTNRLAHEPWFWPNMSNRAEPGPPLWAALENRHASVVRVLCEHGSANVEIEYDRPNLGNKFNKSAATLTYRPVFWLCDNGDGPESFDVVTDPDDDDYDYDDASGEKKHYHPDSGDRFAAHDRQLARAEMLQVLLEHGADPEGDPAVDRSPLMAAAVNPNARQLISTLLRAGARIDREDCRGWKAIHFAADVGSVGAVSALLDWAAGNSNNNADPAAAISKMINAASTNGGFTPLMCAADESRTEVVALILRRCAAVVNVAAQLQLNGKCKQNLAMLKQRR